MRSEEEIRAELARIESIYDKDNIPEFMRGVYNALAWVLNKDISKEN